MRKRCTKGKSCGATCIDRSERCVLELGPSISDSLTKVRSRLGVVKLYQQVRDHKVKGFQGKFNQIRGDLKKEVGGQVRKTADVAELKKRLQEAGLLPQSQKKEDIQDIFKGLFAKGQEEKAPSVPSAMKRELAALGGQQPVVLPPRQLDRSPGARTRTAPAVRRELAGIVESAKKDSMNLMMDDISRIMRGSLPQNLEIVSAGNELGMRARVKTSGAQAGSATGNTRWARDDAGDFDKSFKIYKRIRGDKDMIDWDETVKNGKKIGEGSFGTVLKVGNVAHKRGEVGADEANIIKRVGETGIGPRLLGAEISTKKRDGYGVDLHNGRIAMSVVPGKEMGDIKPDTKLGGKNAADVYWKAMADLHRLGIAHNDAHPHNLLVDDKGKGRWVDMGLAQQSPRAALAEAMGVFKNLKGGDDITVPASAAGNGNWQSRGWKATGIKEADRAKQAGGQTWAEFKQRFPVMSQMWENQDKVIKKLEKSGLDINDINSMMEHGIRSPLPSYDRSDGFSRVSDKQAQDLLNLLYDGI
jgi:hypothetical protein